jgi:glutamate-1-semialdehyde 2,1-aminomutase
VTFAPLKITDYATFRQHQDEELTELACLYNVNRDIFMTPGREESGRRQSPTPKPTPTPS